MSDGSFSATTTNSKEHYGFSNIPSAPACAINYPPNIERMFETFHQSPHGDFKPTFYNPFEIKHRRRTTKAQFRVLENAFQENNKPNAGARRTLAVKLGMTPRAVQVWFQNRRAKSKTSKTDSSENNESMSTSPSLSIDEQSRTERSRSQTAIKVGVHHTSTTLGRRHSMPEIQQPHLNLPFKELQDAIFAPGECVGGSQPQPSQQRKNSGCSATFLNSFLNLGIVGGLENYGMSPNNIPSLYDPMISGDSNARMMSAKSERSDLAAPSISTPGSSPNIATEDLFYLQNTMRLNQPPNLAVVEAMAARLTTSLSAAELDMFLHNFSGQKRESVLDYFANSGDLANLLFPTGEAGNSVNPMELLSCLPHNGDQYSFPEGYPEETMTEHHF